MKYIYLDHAATTPTDPSVVKAMLPYFSEFFGNPSSLHSFGHKAVNAIEQVREQIALFLSARPEEIIFTSGGTESNNFVLQGIAFANQKKGNHIITSSIEHHSILETCKFLENHGFRVAYLKVDSSGVVDPVDVKKAMTDKTILVSIMHANNEIGSIQPIAEIGSIASEQDVYFHTDTVQTFGHLPINVNELNINMLSASAHKLYGPKGVGILYVKRGTRISPLMHGGGQEKKRRPSTENVAGIVGLGKAVELSEKKMNEETSGLTALRDKLIKNILDTIDGCQLNGHPVKRLPGNVNIAIDQIEGESMVLNLDRKGIACSTGSACSSSDGKPSHVLSAIGLPLELAHGSIRFSLGRSTSEEDINYVSNVVPDIVKKLRSTSSA